MTLRHPFQKLCILSLDGEDGPILLTASGPVICSISLENGELLSRWPWHDEEPDLNPEHVHEQDEDSAVRPSKRRKLDSNASGNLSRQTSDASEDSIEIVAERKKGDRRRPKIIDSKLSNVSHILATKDSKHVIAVTADDKSVKVFQTKARGRLRLISERSLPKRLCAVKLTTDEATILVADKFGDVYSLPLHPSPDYVPKTTSQKLESTFVPSATELTVHTKGNLDALRQQREQKKIKPQREGPDFEHKLLLGHVSLLTDLSVAQGTVNGRLRPFILTADRDEHVRVSRGIPQAHIIETYCLGHNEFITKLCIPPWSLDLLIAGNGEPSLRTYHWQTGTPIDIVSLSSQIDDQVKSLLQAEGRSIDKLAISNIWPIEQTSTTMSIEVQKFKGLIIVALEGLPLLLTYAMDHRDQLQYIDTLRLQGNILDIVQVPQRNHILVSLDTLHKVGSFKAYSSDSDSAVTMLERFALTSHPIPQSANRSNGSQVVWEKLEPPLDVRNILEYLPEVPTSGDSTDNRNKASNRLYSPLGEFLYGLENLRKKRDMTTEEEMLEAVEP